MIVIRRYYRGSSLQKELKYTVKTWDMQNKQDCKPFKAKIVPRKALTIFVLKKVEQFAAVKSEHRAEFFCHVSSLWFSNSADYKVCSH